MSESDLAEFDRFLSRVTPANPARLDFMSWEIYDLAPACVAGELMGKRGAEQPKHDSAPPLKGLAGWVSEQLGIPPWGQALIAVMALLVILFGGVLWEGYVRLGKIESAIRVLASQQSEQQKDLVRDLLAQAQKDANSGNAASAGEALRLAAQYISDAKRRKVPVPTNYFPDVVKILNAMEFSPGSGELTQATHLARVAVAEYRSALQPAPELHPDRRTLAQPLVLPPPPRLDPSSASGTVLRWEGPPGGEFINPPFNRLLANNIGVANLTFVGGTQTLDGIHWENVVFFNTHVKFQGGEVALRNVRFINCVFSLDSSPRGERLADYAALGIDSLVLGPKSG